MQKNISKRELKELFLPGTLLKLVNCLMGPTSKPRAVIRATSYGFVMDALDKPVADTGRFHPSYLRFETGDCVTFDPDTKTVTVYQLDGTLAAQYLIEGTVAS